MGGVTGKGSDDIVYHEQDDPNVSNLGTSNRLAPRHTGKISVLYKRKRTNTTVPDVKLSSGSVPV